MTIKLPPKMVKTPENSSKYHDFYRKNKNSDLEPADK